MRTYRCLCDTVVYFDNTKCLGCERELGFCPACSNLVAIVPTADGNYQCGNPDCGVALAKCINYAQQNVCNRCVQLPLTANENRCDCCRFNETIPDLTVPGNWQRWARLETAKRRLFYDLSQLGLPYGTVADGVEPPLTFDFKADVIPKGDMWRSVGKAEKVFTGHDQGRITINIREADDVEREKLRVDMGEAQRTLIGHFRHEIGHFYWDMLVKGRREEECKQVFGDHEHPTYDEALDAYYKNGPRADWQLSFISAYSTMHPWEDFAETWATYLDMISALDTAEHSGFGGESDPVHANLEAMVSRYQQLGMAMNEINRAMGLIDVLPDVFVTPVIAKLQYIHDLVKLGREENKALNPGLAAPMGAVAVGAAP